MEVTMRDAYVDDDDEVRDGVRVRLNLMDADPVQRAIALDARNHRPGFRRANDAARAAVRSARSTWIKQLNDAWKTSQLDARRRRKDDDDDEDDGDDYNETDPDEIGQSAVDGRRRPMLSVSDARQLSGRAYLRMVERLQSAWRMPSRDAAEPDAATQLVRPAPPPDDPSVVMRCHLRTEEDDIAQARRDAAWQEYRNRLSTAWQPGQTDPGRAAVEAQREKWLGK
jgi:hypothetical protein